MKKIKLSILSAIAASMTALTPMMVSCKNSSSSESSLIAVHAELVQPSTQYTVGSKIEAKDFEFLAIYSNNVAKEVKNFDSDTSLPYTFTAQDAVAGTKKITLSYMDKSATVSISVSNSDVEINEVIPSYAKRVYTIGESISADEFFINAKYTYNGEQKIYTLAADEVAACCDVTLPYKFVAADEETPKVFKFTIKDKSASLSIAASKVKVSDDNVKFVDNVNTYLSNFTNLYTCSKALTAALDYGYDVANYTLSTTRAEIVYDSSIQKFIIMADDSIVHAPQGYELPENKFNIWKLRTIYDAKSKYSIYLKDGSYSGDLVTLDVTTGLDVGNNKTIKVINYTGDAETGKSVILRTNSDIINITAPKDNVVHFGATNSVYVNKCETYYEYGKTAYEQTDETTIYFKYLDDVDCCSIDVYDAKDNTELGEQDEKAKIYTSVGEDVATAVYDLDIVEVSTIENLVDHHATAFIRLTDDLLFTQEKPIWQITQGIKIVLDLNGHTLSDKDVKTITSYDQARIFVDVNASLIIMDSKRNTTPGSIDLYNHSIEVKGDADDAANLVLDGANINYYGDSEEAFGKKASRGAIYVGHTGETEAVYKSNFYMYGGKITAKALDPDSTVVGISPRNNGAYVKIIYGEIESDTYCISGNGKYHGTYTEIVGGKFDSKNVCVFHPQKGTLHISDGWFQGYSAIGFKAGNLTISGGVFLSTGTYKETLVSSDSGIDVDGSVIVLDCRNVYSTNPVLTITNAVMFSAHAHILRVIGQEDYTGNGEVDFDGGSFLYKLTDVGYLSSLSSDQCRITKTRGTWIKIV